MELKNKMRKKKYNKSKIIQGHGKTRSLNPKQRKKKKQKMKFR